MRGSVARARLEAGIGENRGSLFDLCRLGFLLHRSFFCWCWCWVGSRLRRGEFRSRRQDIRGCGLCSR
ncbi:hypothetical protein AYK61_21745 [Rhodococcus sp. SBT000017]|nr:hypothetical protein AYK61_21745 [Rhodococcus sp. SBT000017]